MFVPFSNSAESDGPLLKNNPNLPTLEILPYLLGEFSTLMVQEKINVSAKDIGLDIGGKLFEAIYFSDKISYE